MSAIAPACSNCTSFNGDECMNGIGRVRHDECCDDHDPGAPMRQVGVALPPPGGARPGGGGRWLASPWAIKQGLLVYRDATIRRPDGTTRVAKQVRITQKGLAKLAELHGAKPGGEAAH